MRLSVLLLLTLAGCSSLGLNTSNYEQGLQKWVGQPEQALYQGWGVPANVYYISPYAKEITYTKVFRGPIEGDTTPYGSMYYPGLDAGYETSPGYKTYYCQTSFTVENGQVTNYSFSGDDCVAPGM